MSNEDIIKEIEKASKFVSEAARDVKVALCHSRNVMENENNEKAYNKGLEDVWKFLKAFCGMDVGERQKVFGEYVVGKLVENMSPQEALAMIETYEKEQAEIKVGDVVEIESTKKCYVILAIYGKTIWGYSCEGNLSPLQELDGVTITKTGKHIDITCVLEQLRGDNDENN